jgi:hypothetical protein
MAGKTYHESTFIQETDEGVAVRTKKVVDGASGGTVEADITASTSISPDAAGTVSFVDSATPVDITVDQDSDWAVGNTVSFVQKGAGSVTFVAGSGVTLNSYTGSLALSGQYALGGILYCGNDEWIVTGQVG